MAQGLASVASSTSVAAPRGVVVANSAGTVATVVKVATTEFSSGDVRASTTGATGNIYMIGVNSPYIGMSSPAGGAVTPLYGSAVNLRSIGWLYASGASTLFVSSASVTPGVGVFKVGSTCLWMVIRSEKAVRV